jgi:streptogramin lyase
VIGVGQRPGVPAVGDGAVWVPNTGDGTVTRIDPRTNRVNGMLTIGNQLAFYHRDCEGKGSVHSFMVTSFHVRDCDLPSAVGTGSGALWVLQNDQQAVLRIDPRTQRVVARIPLGFTPFDMAASDAAVWVSGYWVDQLVRIDPQSNTIVARLTLPDGVSGIAASAQAVWVASTIAGVVSRIDPTSNTVVQTVTLACPSACYQGSMPLAIAVDDSAVFIRTVGDGLVVRIDPHSNRITATIEVTYPLGRNGEDHIALLDGSLWVAGTRLQRIDEQTNRVSGSIDVLATSVVAGNDSLWITDLRGRVERIDPAGASSS